MGITSLIFQGAALVTILLLKGAFSAEGFVFVITQIAWASILGSIATVRLEHLLFQQRGQVNRADLCVILIFSFCFVCLMVGIIQLVSHSITLEVRLSMVAVILAIGFGLHEAQSFLAVQMQKIPQVLITRICQALGMISGGIAAWYGANSQTVMIIYAASVAAPVLIWFSVHIITKEEQIDWPNVPAATFKRGVILTFSTLTNALYVNCPVLIASATQSVGFVADFGFVMRILTGPITTIKQAFSHTFMASAFKLNLKDFESRGLLWQKTKQVIKRSIGLYSVIQIVLIMFLFLTADILGVTQPSIVFTLFFATVAQVGVNAVSGIRTVTKREKSFLQYDVIRAVALGIVLTIPTGLAFDLVFAFVSFVLYAIYIWFIKIQIIQPGPIAVVRAE